MFDLFKSKKLQTLHSVEAVFKSSSSLINPSDLRKKIKIVAIDDQIFHPENNLRNSGFLIETLSDIQRVSEIENFQIILCDVNGIGSALSSDTQGAYVIKEIKSTYPDKLVVAYTAGTSAEKLVMSAKNYADRYLKKDASVDEWRDLLDDQIKSLCNPIEVWKKTRLRLLIAGIELKGRIQN